MTFSASCVLATAISIAQIEDPGASILAAATAGDAARVRSLIAAGADVESASPSGARPLHNAVSRGHLETTSVLLAAGADPNATFLDGMTPLMIAAGRGNHEMAEVLLEGGADVSSSIEAGMTPLMYAAQNGHLETALLLLSHGASASLEADGIGSAIELAERSGQTNIVSLFQLPEGERSGFVARIHQAEEAERAARLAGTISNEEAPVRVGGDIRPPRKTRDVPPRYPEKMKELGVQGLVLLDSVIDEEGRVTEITVLRSVHPLLDRAAIESVRRACFLPTRLNDQPTSIVYVINVNFVLVPETR